MINIAICEDKLEDMTFLQESLHQLLTEKELSYNLTCFTSGRDMLEALGKQRFAISFIDIYLDEISGIMLAQKIREENREAPIIFTTRSQDYMADGYELGVLHYLVKPFTYEHVAEALERALRVAKYSEQYLEVRVNREMEKILFREIYYIESQNRYCIINTTNDEKSVICRMDDLESQLENDPRFLRCHRSFIVNMDKIYSAEKLDFVLNDKRRVPMNRETLRQLKDTFTNYRINKVREEQ